MSTPALLLDPQQVSSPGTFTTVVVNRGDRSILYGFPFTIEHWDGHQWQKTDLAPDVFLLPLIEVGPGEISQPNTVEIPADVEPGFYRVVKENLTEDDTGTSFDVTALFQVSAGAQPPQTY